MLANTKYVMTIFFELQLMATEQSTNYYKEHDKTKTFCAMINDDVVELKRIAIVVATVIQLFCLTSSSSS